MKKINTYRVRKCSDVEMENPYFEVLDGSESIVFDISKTNEGELQILFYEGVSEKFMSLALLDEILCKVRNEF